MPIPLMALLAATLGAAYILIGYPLLLATMRFKTRPPVAKDLNFAPTVSVILAVSNGEGFIRGKLESIRALDYPRERLQIIVALNGCTDSTESIVREFAEVECVSLAERGKASALNAALAIATGEILFFTDVRQMLDRGALRNLAA